MSHSFMSLRIKRQDNEKCRYHDRNFKSESLDLVRDLELGSIFYKTLPFEFKIYAIIVLIVDIPLHDLFVAFELSKQLA